MDELIEATTNDGINWSAVDAIAGEGGADGAQAGPQAAPAMTPGQEVAAMLEAFSVVVRPILPRVAAIYTPETCKGIGAALDPLCAKYGWLQGGFQWGAEIAAAIVIIPVVVQTAAAAKLDVMALKAAKEAAAEKVKPEAAEGAE